MEICMTREGWVWLIELMVREKGRIAEKLIDIVT